jgi:hypothetical protein
MPLGSPSRTNLFVTETKGRSKVKAIGKTVVTSVVSVLAGVGIVAGGLFVAGLASASDTTPTAQVTGSSQAGTSNDAERPRLLQGAVHADITASSVDGSTRTFSADRGRIEGVNGATVTLQQPGGTTVSVPTSESTCIRKDGQPASLQDLEVGAPALALQEKGTAVIVRSGRPDPGTDRQPCGVFRDTVHADIDVTYLDGSSRTFAYDRGQITSITDTQITLVRRDQKSVTLNYDDSTFVRENGQTESVSDLKVGERAMFFSENGLAKLIRCVSRAPAA